MNWRAMHGLESGSDLDDVADLLGVKWTHGHDHVALELPCGTARDSSFVHGNVFAFLDVAYGKAGLQQGFFKGE